MMKKVEDTDDSLSDAEYEAEEQSEASPDEEDERMSPIAYSTQSSQENLSSLDEDDDITDTVIDGGLQPDVARHIEECIDAVVEQFRGRYSAPDGTVWTEAPHPNGKRQAVNIMRSAGGLSAMGRRNCQETALSNWNIFISDSMLDTIVDCTNDKAQSIDPKFVTSRQEIAAYIGVGILIGVYKGRGEPVRSIWSESEGRKCISQFISRRRYELIKKYMEITKVFRNNEILSVIAILISRIMCYLFYQFFTKSVCLYCKIAIVI